MARFQLPKNQNTWQAIAVAIFLVIAALVATDTASVGGVRSVTARTALHIKAVTQTAVASLPALPALLPSLDPLCGNNTASSSSKSGSSSGDGSSSSRKVPSKPPCVYRAPAVPEPVADSDAGLADDGDTIVGPVEDVGNSTSLLDIVIAYRMEPLDTVMQDVARLLNMSVVQKLQPRVFAYVKGGELAPFRNRLAPLLGDAGLIANGTQGKNATNVVSMPDVGSGAHTFVSHIIQNYDDLGKHVLFLSTAERMDDGFLRLEHVFSPQTGYLGLSTPSFCSCITGCGFKGTLMGLRDMFHFMTKQLCHLQTGETFSHFERSQFVVSRRRLRARPLRFWKQMLELLGPAMPWRSDGNYLEGDDKVKWMDQASPVEPLFAKIMDRSWGLAFHCWNATVAAQCKCMPDLPAWQCHPSQCQCLDDHKTGRLLNGFYSLPFA